MWRGCACLYDSVGAPASLSLRVEVAFGWGRVRVLGRGTNGITKRV